VKKDEILNEDVTPEITVTQLQVQQLNTPCTNTHNIHYIFPR